MRQGAQGWCTGMTLRDRMGREVGDRGSRWGTHVHPWLIHDDVWQKPLKKLISSIVKMYGENTLIHW